MARGNMTFGEQSGASLTRRGLLAALAGLGCQALLPRFASAETADKPFVLEAKPSHVRFLPQGAATPVWGYGGTVPGPEIRVRQGGEVFARLIHLAREVKKPIVHTDLAAHVEPGTSGRFYLFKSIDHRGIHAVRPQGGSPVFRYPRTNELVGMGLALFAVAWIALSMTYAGDVSIFALIVLVLGALAWIVNWQLRRSAERQFADDNGGMI